MRFEEARGGIEDLAVPLFLLSLVVPLAMLWRPLADALARRRRDAAAGVAREGLVSYLVRLHRTAAPPPSRLDRARENGRRAALAGARPPEPRPSSATWRAWITGYREARKELR